MGWNADPVRESDPEGTGFDAGTTESDFLTYLLWVLLICWDIFGVCVRTFIVDFWRCLGDAFGYFADSFGHVWDICSDIFRIFVRAISGYFSVSFPEIPPSYRPRPGIMYVLNPCPYCNSRIFIGHLSLTNTKLFWQAQHFFLTDTELFLHMQSFFLFFGGHLFPNPRPIGKHV